MTSGVYLRTEKHCKLISESHKGWKHGFKKGHIPKNKKYPDYWTCQQCSKNFKHNGRIQKYCSKTCYSKSMIGHKPPKTAFKQGKEHIGWMGGCRQYLQKIARKVYYEFFNKYPKVIHHIDGNPNNNNPINLCGCSISYHAKIHHFQGDIHKNKEVIEYFKC